VPERLETRLAQLAREVDYPPTPELAAAVRRRLDAQAPRRSRSRRALALATPASAGRDLGPRVTLAQARRLAGFPILLARTAGRALLWQHGPLLLRLEADVGPARALQIARSVQ
jgi:hypothetical protein